MYWRTASTIREEDEPICLFSDDDDDDDVCMCVLWCTAAQAVVVVVVTGCTQDRCTTLLLLSDVPETVSVSV